MHQYVVLNRNAYDILVGALSTTPVTHATTSSTSADPLKPHHDMDRTFNAHAGLGESKSFRPNLYTSKSFIGTHSDPEKKSRSSKPKSHRHHDQHDDRHGPSRRHAAKEAVQSAMQPPTSFGDLLKQARGSKEGSPGHSRKGSVAQLKDDGSVKGREIGDVGVVILPPKTSPI